MRVRILIEVDDEVWADQEWEADGRGRVNNVPVVVAAGRLMADATRHLASLHLPESSRRSQRPTRHD